MALARWCCNALYPYQSLLALARSATSILSEDICFSKIAERVMAASRFRTAFVESVGSLSLDYMISPRYVSLSDLTSPDGSLFTV